MFSVPPATMTSASPARMLRALNDALHAGAADHANGVGGDLEGDAGLHSGLTGGVLAQAGGEDTAKHDLVHLLGLQAGAVEASLMTTAPISAAGTSFRLPPKEPMAVRQQLTT